MLRSAREILFNTRELLSERARELDEQAGEVKEALGVAGAQGEVAALPQVIEVIETVAADGAGEGQPQQGVVAELDVPDGSPRQGAGAVGGQRKRQHQQRRRRSAGSDNLHPAAPEEVEGRQQGVNGRSGLEKMEGRSQGATGRPGFEEAVEQEPEPDPWELAGR